MNYSIDFAKITLSQYKDQLKKRSFIPSRQILKDEADVHFNAFQKANIKNLEQLFSIINNKKTKNELLKEKEVSDEYLTILLRELKSIQSKPLKLSEFVWISQNAINKLEKQGIVNTKVLYEKIGKANDRKKIIEETNIDEETVIELLKLSDLVRIQWVNSTFAHILLVSGFDTVEKVSMANYEDLYNKISKKNEVLKLYKGKIGLNDMKLCVEAAKSIPIELEL
jgi:hypothetical protein